MGAKRERENILDRARHELRDCARRNRGRPDFWPTLSPSTANRLGIVSRTIRRRFAITYNSISIGGGGGAVRGVSMSTRGGPGSSNYGQGPPRHCSTAYNILYLMWKRKTIGWKDRIIWICGAYSVRRRSLCALQWWKVRRGTCVIFFS